jgi:carbonic anhydrase
MGIIDNALKANRNYAKRHDARLAQRPAPKIAVVTCMDPSPLEPPGNIGAAARRHRCDPYRWTAVTEDVLGELVVSTRVLGTTEIMLLNHTVLRIYYLH